jgi:gamma-glutamyltranspeptidase
MVYDAREFAPGAASQDMFKDDPNQSQYGGKAVAVVSEPLPISVTRSTQQCGRV